MIESVSINGPIRTSSLRLTSEAATSRPAGAPNFEQTLAQLVEGSLGTIKSGEAAAIGGMRGTLPIHDVVEAVLAAERSLQTGLALRDKAVGAWQEISRMSI